MKIQYDDSEESVTLCVEGVSMTLNEPTLNELLRVLSRNDFPWFEEYNDNRCDRCDRVDVSDSDYGYCPDCDRRDCDDCDRVDPDEFSDHIHPNDFDDEAEARGYVLAEPEPEEPSNTEPAIPGIDLDAIRKFQAELSQQGD
jgi:hypothetical protein